MGRWCPLPLTPGGLRVQGLRLLRIRGMARDTRPGLFRYTKSWHLLSPPLRLLATDCTTSTEPLLFPGNVSVHPSLILNNQRSC